jgi:hypothetical protein
MFEGKFSIFFKKKDFSRSRLKLAFARATLSAKKRKASVLQSVPNNVALEFFDVVVYFSEIVVFPETSRKSRKIFSQTIVPFLFLFLRRLRINYANEFTLSPIYI